MGIGKIIRLIPFPIKKVLQDLKLYPIIRILVFRLKNIILSSGRALPLMHNLYSVKPYTKVKKINSNNKMILIFWES